MDDKTEKTEKIKKLKEVDEKIKTGSYSSLFELISLLSAIKDTKEEQVYSKLISPQTKEETILSFNKNISKLLETLLKQKTIIPEILDILKDINKTTSKEKEELETIKCLQERIVELERENKAITKRNQPSEKRQTLAKPVKNYIIPNTKVANNLTNTDMLETGLELIVSNKKNKKEISIYSQLTYEGENIKLSGKHNFTEYDRVVHNSVCSLWEAGNEVITANMVFRVIKADQQAVPSPNQKGAITKSIEKSRVTKLTIDFTQEATEKKWNIEGNENKKIIMDDMLLSAIKGSYSINGSVVEEAYKINTMPILYKYSQQSNQVISVPVNLLYISDVVNDTDESIKIKDYLIRRIEAMKGKTEQSNTILLESLFDALEIKTKNRTQKKRHIDTINAILGKWKKQKYIREYSFIKEGQSTKKIKIKV